MILQGETNPVLCALSAIKRLFPIYTVNEESFRALAVGMERKLGEPGFLVLDWSDITKLCEIGNFCIMYDMHGRLMAKRGNYAVQ